ncbi:lineage-specific thermal regulator protein [Methanobrevibacter cuticularis]|uniref:Lineage-specific thermal regulator protein n=1 Tax=Methanobrevibacter cuticularis TaxID=47311 RepID=A0A166ECE4_9EURY|nr:PadR family transcriptional regulator [Methanobrevibacter cuticularis]KZX16502.1 lineage-specific thermal regulator protein [Methanobrevibacter cuticularis]
MRDQINKKFEEHWHKFGPKSSFHDFDKKLLKHSIGGMMKKKLVTFIILWIITKERTYGYELIKKLNEGWECPIEDDDLKEMQEDKKRRGREGLGSNRIYPILRDLERKGLIEGTWEMEGKRKIKYYEATQKGVVTMNKVQIILKTRTPPIFKEFIKENIFDD